MQPLFAVPLPLLIPSALPIRYPCPGLPAFYLTPLESNPCVKRTRNSNGIISLRKKRGGGGVPGALSMPNRLATERLIAQALTGVDSIGAGSTGAGSMKLRPRRSGPNATIMPNITMVKISNPASAQP